MDAALGPCSLCGAGFKTDGEECESRITIVFRSKKRQENRLTLELPFCSFFFTCLINQTEGFFQFMSYHQPSVGFNSWTNGVLFTKSFLSLISCRALPVLPSSISIIPGTKFCGSQPCEDSKVMDLRREPTVATFQHNFLTTL